MKTEACFLDRSLLDDGDKTTHHLGETPTAKV
jgi:hypothetical protein